MFAKWESLVIIVGVKLEAKTHGQITQSEEKGGFRTSESSTKREEEE